MIRTIATGKRRYDQVKWDDREEICHADSVKLAEIRVYLGRTKVIGLRSSFLVNGELQRGAKHHCLNVQPCSVLTIFLRKEEVLIEVSGHISDGVCHMRFVSDKNSVYEYGQPTRNAEPFSFRAPPNYHIVGFHGALADHDSLQSIGVIYKIKYPQWTPYTHYLFPTAFKQQQLSAAPGVLVCLASARYTTFDHRSSRRSTICLEGIAHHLEMASSRG